MTYITELLELRIQIEYKEAVRLHHRLYDLLTKRFSTIYSESAEETDHYTWSLPRRVWWSSRVGHYPYDVEAICTVEPSRMSIIDSFADPEGGLERAFAVVEQAINSLPLKIKRVEVAISAQIDTFQLTGLINPPDAVKFIRHRLLNDALNYAPLELEKRHGDWRVVPSVTLKYSHKGKAYDLQIRGSGGPYVRVKLSFQEIGSMIDKITRIRELIAQACQHLQDNIAPFLAQSDVPPAVEAPTSPKTPPLDFEWVDIPEGEFYMGTPAERVEKLMEKHKSVSFRHEAPQRAVYLPDFQISKYPVTNAQYKAFVDATGRGAPWDYPKDKADHPVTRVNLHAAWAFCHWAGCRLPTEVEWEKAARGTDGREYPWGNEWREGCCNSREANVLGTTPVGYYEAGASPYGVYDMAGNAWEWTDGWLISDVVPLVWWAEGSSRWDSAKYGERMDRQYKSALNWPVLRGGGIDSNRLGVRCAFRLIGYEPFIDGDFFGFRCVRY